MIIFKQSEYQKYIYYVQGIYKKSYTIPEGYIVVKIDIETLNSLLKNFEETKDSRCFLINQTEGYMGTDINDEALVSKILEKQQPSGNVFLNSGFYSYSIADSQYMNVEYCYVTSIFKYYKAVFDDFSDNHQYDWYGSSKYMACKSICSRKYESAPQNYGNH